MASDPANKHVFVSEVRVVPEDAQLFVKVEISSNIHANTTRVLIIEGDDDNEVTGNVSIFAELSAYNQNYTIYVDHDLQTRSEEWRWRKVIYGFNLTIIPEYNHTEPPISAEIDMCDNKYISYREK